MSLLVCLASWLSLHICSLLRGRRWAFLGIEVVGGAVTASSLAGCACSCLCSTGGKIYLIRLTDFAGPGGLRTCRIRLLTVR